MDEAGESQKTVLSQETLWSYRIGDTTVENVPESELKRLISTGQLGRDTLARASGTESWEKVSGIKALSPAYEEKPAPIRRFFARICDYVLYGLFLATLVGIIWNFYPPIDIIYSGDAVASVVTSIFTVCTWAIWETVFLSTFGTTPGKWLFNVRVRNSSGNKLTIREGCLRSFGVTIKGMGLGIIVLYIATTLYSLYKLLKDGKTPWDRDGSIVVSGGRIGLIRALVIVCFIGIYALDTVLSLPGSVVLWF